MYHAKIKDIEDKILDNTAYITTNDFNKLSGTVFDEILAATKISIK